MMRLGTLLPRWRARLATWRHPAVICLGPVPDLSDACGDASGDALPAPQSLVPRHDATLLAWRSWCEAHAGQRCRVALSGQWLLSWMATSEAARPDRREARAAAAVHWAHYLNLDAATLSNDWMLQLVRVPGGVLVCAAPRMLVDDVLAVAAHHGVRVVWMGPWWARGVERWLAHGPAREHETRLLSMAEGGWRIHVEARGQRLQRLWMLKGDDAMASASALALGPEGLSDDDATVALVQGRSAAWHAATSGTVSGVPA